MSFKFLAVSFALVAALATTGCAKTIAEKVIENQTGGKVKIDSNGKSGSVEIKSKDGSIRIGENKLPADFPKDIPIYKPSKTTSSMSNTLEGKKTFVVTLTTDADIDGVTDFYKSGLAGKGWTEKSALTGGDGASKFSTLAYEKGETIVTVTVTRANNDKETQMVLSVSPKN